VDGPWVRSPHCKNKTKTLTINEWKRETNHISNLIKYKLSEPTNYKTEIIRLDDKHTGPIQMNAVSGYTCNDIDMHFTDLFTHFSYIHTVLTTCQDTMKSTGNIEIR
jgi:hypothetical protein